jgi:hypothetical protein
MYASTRCLNQKRMFLGCYSLMLVPSMYGGLFYWITVMSFVKYIHLERFGTDEVDGINLGECHIFPKIDGTNSSVWLGENGLCFGSRNRELSFDNDNAGFAVWASNQQSLFELLAALPCGSRVFGEWLVPHSLKSYRDDAWRRFYVFDILVNETFLHYNEYKTLCDAYGVDYIPCICVAKNPDYEILSKEAEKNRYLIEENKGIGEGIVIKQYGYKNKFGRTTWAKVITNQFKDKHIKAMGGSVVSNAMVEDEIAKEFVSMHFVEKIISKIINEKGAFCSESIPALLGMAYHDLVTEELWQAIKKHKNPKIDFKALNSFCIKRVKELKPEFF